MFKNFSNQKKLILLILLTIFLILGSFLYLKYRVVNINDIYYSIDGNWYISENGWEIIPKVFEACNSAKCMTDKDTNDIAVKEFGVNAWLVREKEEFLPNNITLTKSELDIYSQYKDLLNHDPEDLPEVFECLADPNEDYTKCEEKYGIKIEHPEDYYAGIIASKVNTTKERVKAIYKFVTVFYLSQIDKWQKEGHQVESPEFKALDAEFRNRFRMDILKY